jgi:hypothetical protein
MTGLCISAHGPVAGGHHDSYLFNQSELAGILEDLEDELEARLYADSAYAKIPGLMSSFKGALEPNIRIGQNRLCSVRGEVEHYFALVTGRFRGITNKMEMKAGKRPIPAYVFSALFLTNCLVCANGGCQTSARFACSPPSLQQYLLYCCIRQK